MADEVFNQADVNKDQRLDLHEFRHLIAKNLGTGAAIYSGNIADGGQYTASSFETSSTAGYGDGAGDLRARTSSGVGNVSGTANYSSYEQAAYSPSSPGGASGFEINVAGGGDVASAAGGVSTSSSFETANVQQQSQQYAANAQGLFQDPNPQIIRRPAQGGQVTYTQNVKIRFLQPPAVPPPGPLIIKEVRPPQPPAPPPLVVRQRAPPLPQPPPLILRERPPPAPASVASQTVIRKLPPVPVPPRSVIIERLPPLPPKPRDIIIERWIPYSAMAKRKTIVQRAEAAKGYSAPRNVIIQYEAPQVRVIRQFQRLGVTPENPQAYVQRYGTSLFDAQALVQQARAAGVIEDISPPASLTVVGETSSSSNVEFANVSAGGIGAGAAVSAAGGDGGAASSSTFETSSFVGQQGGASLSGFETAQGGFVAPSAFRSNSFSTKGGGIVGSGGYQGYSSSTGGNIDLVHSAFNAVDLNKDGSIDANEFRQFVGGSQIQ